MTAPDASTTSGLKTVQFTDNALSSADLLMRMKAGNMVASKPPSKIRPMSSPVKL
jgi:hypothetical protein